MVTHTQPGMAQYASTMSNLITLLQNSDGLYSLNNDSLKTYSLSTTANNANTQGYEAARGIMKKIYGNRYLEKIMPKPVPSGSGLRELSEEKEITSLNVFPNPSSDLINIEINAKAEIKFKCHIVSLQGLLLQDNNLHIGVNQLDIQKLSAGIYLLDVFANGDLYAKTKIVVVK